MDGLTAIADSTCNSIREQALDILRTHRVAVIATSSQDVPWASTVYYAEDGLTIYVNTPSQTTMLRNMLANPRVALTVDEREPVYFLLRPNAVALASPWLCR